jgi:hypothetical protein
MINIQLLDYIKQQLAQGLSKELIQQNLISTGGWNLSDITDAFSEIGINIAPANNRKIGRINKLIFTERLISALVAFFILALFASLYFGLSIPIPPILFIIALAVSIALIFILKTIISYLKNKYGNIYPEPVYSKSSIVLSHLAKWFLIIFVIWYCMILFAMRSG